jgi:hypothetical protein
VKFLAKLGKSATETYNLLVEVCGDVMSVYLVLKFSSGSKDLKTEPRPGRPCTSKTHKMKKSVKLFDKNRCLSIRAVAVLANIGKESVRQILHEHFNTKNCALRWR